MNTLFVTYFTNLYYYLSTKTILIFRIFSKNSLITRCQRTLTLWLYRPRSGAYIWSFKCARHENDTTTLFPGNDEISVKLRSESIGDEEIVLLNKLTPNAYDEKIEQIHKFYKADKGIELCRKIKELDAYRHADYPDDVAVIFYDQEKEPEYCWVRCEDCQPPRFFGTLLNEPKIIEGIHKNDKVVFNLIEVKDGFFVAVFLRWYSTPINEWLTK